MDINLAIAQMGLSHCKYKLDQQTPPHKIRAWYGPDKQPTAAELQTAWEEYQSIVIVPESIDMRRARLSLRKAGLLDAVNTAIASMEGDVGEDARIEWEYATTIRRDNPLVAAMQQALGLTDQQLDDLFITASQLQ